MVGMLPGLLDQLPASTTERGQHAAHHAAGAQVAHQGAGIDIADDGDAGAGEKGIGRRVAAPVAGDGGKLADHQAFDVGPAGFVVLGAGSVVADLGIGQDDDLARIGRIREDFLVSGEGRIEDNFTGPLGGRTKAPALEDGPVFQGEDCRVQFRMIPPREWITFSLPGAGMPRRLRPGPDGPDASVGGRSCPL